ncbi:Mu-like prophage major head subunit gpT family protein [Vibrio quintilis]|uniref:Mu-like prophage major head subunit gpT n=1 Tax=Vibrio quintilis TaxID=1117707 RepID=A0A1M7YTT9_9VIBR|nr:Mu-like prophage major head subunit gpT family protein [Vibrio quintilis]SHO56070.1 Mu-like prophage major head subunit gpT [Vibrio quintilis]
MNDLKSRVIGASTAFNARFDKGVELALTDYTKIATVIPSQTSTTGYGFLDRFPKIREWLGDREINKLQNHNYQIPNRKFEATIGIPREDYEDNDYGKYSPVFEDMGREASEFPNEHIFGLLKTGFTELCFDGKPFFSDKHPVGRGEINQSNLFSDGTKANGSAWYLIDASRALKPLIWQERTKPELEAKNNPAESDHVFMHDEILYGIRARGNAGFSSWQLAAASHKALNTDNFNAVYKMMTSRKDHQNRPMHIRPTLLIVPPSLRQQAYEVVLKEKIDGGDSNINFNIVDVYVCPYLE